MTWFEPPGPITEWFRTSNYIECGLWCGIGVGFAAAMFFKAGAVRTRCAVAAVTFLVFGVSDYVEAHTGAWWFPWWLFVWKAACVVVLGGLMVAHYRKGFSGRG